MKKSIAALALIALVVAGAAFAGPRIKRDHGGAHQMTANMKASAEVPKPAGVRSSAVGLFTANEKEHADGTATVTWKLTFKHLTGAATAAHIHIGKVGTAGPVAAPLCGPCKSGATGTVTLTKAQDTALEAGRAYVNIHTAKNPAGEIRGQIKESK